MLAIICCRYLGRVSYIKVPGDGRVQGRDFSKLSWSCLSMINTKTSGLVSAKHEKHISDAFQGAELFGSFDMLLVASPPKLK